LCSSWCLFQAESSKLRSMLLRNAYPSWILDRIIKRSINTFMHPSVKYGPQKERLYIGLPYVESTTEQVRRSIKQIITNNSYHIKTSLFTSSQVYEFLTFFVARTIHLLSLNCKRILLTNIRALTAISANFSFFPRYCVPERC